MLLFSLITVICIVLFTAWASSNIGSGVFLKAKCHSNTFKKGVLLTFDDGPHPKNTLLILDILEKNNIKAVFFVIGSQAEKYPEIVKKISEKGHLIGNHSYSHSNFLPFFFRKMILSELEKTAEIIENITGKTPVFFRPPFGVTNPGIAYAAKKMNYLTIGWSVRSKDTVLKNGERILKKVGRLIKGGDIVLFHDKVNGTVEVLDKLINECRSGDFEFTEPEEFLTED